MLQGHRSLARHRGLTREVPLFCNGVWRASGFAAEDFPGVDPLHASTQRQIITCLPDPTAWPVNGQSTTLNFTRRGMLAGPSTRDQNNLIRIRGLGSVGLTLGNITDIRWRIAPGNTLIDRSRGPTPRRFSTHTLVPGQTKPLDPGRCKTPDATIVGKTLEKRASPLKELSRRPLEATSVPRNETGDIKPAIRGVGGLKAVGGIGAITMSYQIPPEVMFRKISPKRGKTNEFWSHGLYLNQAGRPVNVHYCKTIEGFDRTACLFLRDKVVGFDMEWVPCNLVRSNSARLNVSLMQIANESDIALFHIASIGAEVAESKLIPPNLRKVLESKDILKVGVNTQVDAKRVSKYLGVQPQGIFELSDLHNRVFGLKNQQGVITRRLVSLSMLAQLHLYLPLDKDTSRISDWSVELSDSQKRYAASDAYAALRIFDVLEEKRRTLDPSPEFPECRVIPIVEPLSEEEEGDAPHAASLASSGVKSKTPVLDNPDVRKASFWADSYRKGLINSGRELKAHHSQLKAYALWHNGGRDVKQIAKLWRDPPVKPSTVVMYLLEAIRVEGLPYHQERLSEVVKYIPKDFAGENGRYPWAYVSGITCTKRDTNKLW